MRQKLLNNDPENVAYQAYVGTTLNNIGSLLQNMGRIEEAKQRYEESLAIYTEPMQYLTMGKKSGSIIRLIELNSELAKKGNQYDQMRCLKEAVKLCKKYQDFFIKYELKHERELVTGAGLSAYIDFLLKNIRAEHDAGKRAGEYEKAIKAVEKLKYIGEDEVISKLCDSTSYYLSGRKLVNEALSSKQPDLERLNQAMEQFKKATETYEKANVCYCVYTGLFEVLKEIEKSEEIDVLRLKKVVEEVTKALSDDVNSSIRALFENLPQICEEKDFKTRDKLLFDFLEKINSIDYPPLENLFEYVHRRTKDHFEEPFNPIKLIYENWKLKIIFDDPEEVKGKLTIKAGNRTLFNKPLTPEERKNNSLEIDYLEKKYFPEGKDEITFSVREQKKTVIRSIDYFESIPGNKKIRILQHDCCNNSFEGSNLRIAVVQLRYDVYGEDYAVKILESEAYERKVMAILEAVKEEADIVVFPEFSIPFGYLEDIQKYANENGIIVFAGTHYVMEENLEKYEKSFASDFGEGDFRKNICPVVIPNSEIIHSEKMFGAKEERDLFFHKGMKQGKLNHIFKLRDNLNLGVLICFEYLNDELRHRLISACDVILVPQTNPNPSRFYSTAKNDLNNPLCAENKACVMANGIFKIGKMKNGQFVPEKEGILGGSSGIMLTLDKDSNKMQDEGISSHIKDQKEQFVLLATVNTQYSAARDLQTAQKPVETALIHIFEEKDIRLMKKENKEEFLTLIQNINSCTSRIELKNLIEKNRPLIEEYSPLMYESTSNLNNLDFEETKERCRAILIPAN